MSEKTARFDMSQASRILMMLIASSKWSSLSASAFRVGRICSLRSIRFSSDSLESPNSLEQYVNKNNARDQVFSAMSGDGGVKVTVATVRNIVNDVSIQHNMTPVSADALGKTMTCALLMSNGLQVEQNVQISLDCDGPIGNIVAIASGKGNVRGYVGSPALEEMPLTDAVGRGAVQIVKSHPKWTKPYSGITPIHRGDIDSDISVYLSHSEQRSCALAAATEIDGILCRAAGGYLIEQLPGVEEATVTQVESNLAKLSKTDGSGQPAAGLLRQGISPVEISEMILADLNMKPLQQIDPKLVCDCSADRLFRAFRLLPQKDVEEILSTQEDVEVSCQFCSKTYRMGPGEIRKHIEAETATV